MFTGKGLIILNLGVSFKNIYCRINLLVSLHDLRFLKLSNTVKAYIKDDKNFHQVFLPSFLSRI